MMARWEILSARINALSRRERVLVLLGVLALVVAVMNAILLDPVSKRASMLSVQLASAQAQVKIMNQQLQMLDTVPPVDPDVPNRERLAVLRQQLQQTNTSLEMMQKQLVSPDKMTGLIEDLLRKNTQLKLVSLKTLPPRGMLATDGAGPAQAANPSAKIAEFPLYRHGVELKVRGRYLDLLNYLLALEKLPWHMLWGNISLASDAYPQSTMTLTIYTLSLDKAWLSI